MFGRQRRAAAREQAEREARAQAEADALFAEADRLDDLTGQPDGYRQEITAERAARIRAQLGADLVIGDADQLAAVLGIQGADLEAEIDRLAAPEREASARRARAEADVGAALDYYRSSPGSDDHRAAYREAFTEAGGAGYALPDDMDLSYESDNAGELAAERYYEELAERHYRELGEHEGEAAGERGRAEANWRERDELTEPVQAPGDEPGPDAARWTPGQDRDEAVVAGELLSEHVARAEDAWRRERRATAGEHLAEIAHDEQALSWARQDAEAARGARESATCGAHAAAADLQRSALGPELSEAGGRSPLPRVLETSPATLAPVAATLADGTPHASPVLAERGWQAHGGVYVRQPQAQLEAG